MFGVIPSACRDAGIPYNSNYDEPAVAKEIPNPIAWSLGTRLYLALSAAAFDDLNIVNEDHLKELWRQGLRIREAVQYFSSANAIGALGQLYKQFVFSNLNNDHETIASQILGITANIVNAKNMRAYQRIPGPENAGSGYYYTSTYAATGGSRVNPDPLQVVLDNNVVRLEGVNSNDGRTAYKIIINKGPKKDQELVPGVRMLQFGGGTNGVRSFAFDSTNSGNFGQPALTVIDDVLGAAQILAFEYCYVPFMKETLPQQLFEKMFDNRNASLCQNFMWSGNVIRLAATIAKWRSTPENVDSEKAALLQNVATLPCTPEGIRDLLSAELGSPDLLPDSDVDPGTWGFDWSYILDYAFPDWVVRRIDDLIYSAASVAPEQGIPEIDTTLKMLGGYMKLRNVVNPAPIYKPIDGPQPGAPALKVASVLPNSLKID